MRAPTLPRDRFIPWADSRWTRLPAVPGGGFEEVRWSAALATDAIGPNSLIYDTDDEVGVTLTDLGVVCTVVAYRAKSRGARTPLVRLAVQGVGRELVAALTKRVYDTYFAEVGRSGGATPYPVAQPRWGRNGGRR